MKRTDFTRRTDHPRPKFLAPAGILSRGSSYFRLTACAPATITGANSGGEKLYLRANHAHTAELRIDRRRDDVAPEAIVAIRSWGRATTSRRHFRCPGPHLRGGVPANITDEMGAYPWRQAEHNDQRA